MSSRPVMPSNDVLLLPEASRLQRLPPTTRPDRQPEGQTLPGISYDRPAAMAAPMPPPSLSSPPGVSWPAVRPVERPSAFGLRRFIAAFLSSRVSAQKTSAENMDLSPFAAQGGQSHFRGENVNSLVTSFPPRKSGQSPVNARARPQLCGGVDTVAAVRYKEGFLAAEYYRKEPLRELQ